MLPKDTGNEVSYMYYHLQTDGQPSQLMGNPQKTKFSSSDLLDTRR